VLSIQKQLEIWSQKQKKLIDETADQKDKDYLVCMWHGFLSGLRLHGTISKSEFDALYNDIYNFALGYKVA